jgi:hypothetical protein
MAVYKRITKELKDLNLLVDDTKIRVALYDEDKLGHSYIVRLVDDRTYNFRYNSKNEFEVYAQEYELSKEECLEYYNKLKEEFKNVEPEIYHNFNGGSSAKEYNDCILITRLSQSRYFRDFGKPIVLSSSFGLDYDSKIVGGPQKIYCTTKVYTNTYNELKYFRTEKTFWNNKKFTKETLSIKDKVVDKSNELHKLMCDIMIKDSTLQKEIHRYGNGSVYIHNDCIIVDNKDLAELYRDRNLPIIDNEKNVLHMIPVIADRYYPLKTLAIQLPNMVLVYIKENEEIEIPEISYKGINKSVEYRNIKSFVIKQHFFDKYGYAIELDELILVDKKLKNMFKNNTKKIVLI